MDAKQFAWLYLVEQGMAGRTPSYYGGFEIDDKSKKRCKGVVSDTYYWNAGTDPLREQFFKEIREHGVDWDKTEPPQSETHSQFTDTFHDPTYKEYLEGVLVLNNGIKQPWCGEALEVTNVFDMMAAVSTSEERFIKAFGTRDEVKEVKSNITKTKLRRDTK